MSAIGALVVVICFHIKTFLFVLCHRSYEHVISDN